MADLLGPMQTVLSGLTQNLQSQDQHTAAADRANMARIQMQREQMQREMENNLNLSASLMKYDKEEAFKAFNTALGYIGRSVEWSNFDVAADLFSQAADLKVKQDFQGMQTLLKGADKYLVNLKDRNRAAMLEQEAQRGVAEQQAQSVIDLQEPQLAQARELVRMAEPFAQGRLAPDEALRLTGSSDPREQAKAFEAAKAMVNGSDAKRQLYAHLFAYDAKAYEQFAQTTGAALGNPKLAADARIAELLAKPNRTEDETNELSAKIDVYAPDSLRTLWNEKSAVNQKVQILSRIEETQARSAALKTNLEIDSEASLDASRLDEALAEQGPENLTDSQAKDAALVQGTRSLKAKTYEEKYKPKIAELEQAAEASSLQARDLSRRAVSALPAQREKLEEQIKEFQYMAKASQAQARLLGAESPYAISMKEAEIPFLLEEHQPKARRDLEALKLQREDDLTVVQEEKARLARREALLQTQLRTTQKKEEQEEAMRMAQQGAIEAIGNGRTRTQAIRDASKALGVGAGELAKKLDEYYGSGIAEANIEYASRLASLFKQRGEMPSHGEILKIKAEIGKKWQIDPKGLAELEKDPSKAGQMNVNLLSPETQGKIAQDRTLVDTIDDLIGTFKPGYVGAIDAPIGEWGQKFGWLPIQREQWLAKSRLLMTDLRYGKFGASLTKNEKEEAIKALPNEQMGDNQWLASAEAWRENWGRLIDERMRVARESRGVKQAPLSAQEQADFERLRKANPTTDPAVIEQFLRQRKR